MSEPAALPVEGRHLCGLTWVDGQLWYSDAGLEEIVGVDPETGAVTARLACPDVVTGLTVSADGGRFIQVVGPPKRLRVLDRGTGEVVAEYANPRPGAELCGLQDSPAGLWFGFQVPPVIELRSHEDFSTVVSVPVDEDVADLALVGDRIVFANHANARLNVIDPAQGRIVASVAVSGGPTGLAWDGSRFWYCDHATDHLRSVDGAFVATA